MTPDPSTETGGGEPRGEETVMPKWVTLICESCGGIVDGPIEGGNVCECDQDTTRYEAVAVTTLAAHRSHLEQLAGELDARAGDYETQAAHKSASIDWHRNLARATGLREAASLIREKGQSE